MSEVVTYGIDAGVGSLAWVRLGGAGCRIEVGHGPASRDELARMFLKDLRSSATSVGIGIDAPMWVMDEPRPRFAEELGRGNTQYRWYLRSGAAATAMAWLVLPRLLRTAGQVGRGISTDLSRVSAGGPVYAFEGYAAGDFKVSSRIPVATSAERNMADALTVAAAGWVSLAGGDRDTLVERLKKADQSFHAAVVQAVADGGNPRQPTFLAKDQDRYTAYSIWNAMAEATGCTVASHSRKDCDVYLFA